MIHVYVLVEGQTEELFINEVIAPRYAPRSVYFSAILVETRRGHKGGLVSYAKVKPQIERVCKEHHRAGAYVTTFFDLYALPVDFPHKQHPTYLALNDPYAKVQYLEQQLSADIAQPHFVPFIMLHEFEALLFVEPQRFADWTDAASIVQTITQISQSYDSPELINDSPQTTPSKRILGLMPSYDKVVQGTCIAADIGLDRLRASCPHFDGWLRLLEQRLS